MLAIRHRLICYGLSEGEYMAIWQFEFAVVNSKINTLNMLNDNKPFFLQEHKSWCSTTIQYGCLEETCIEFSLTDSVVEEILCRIDVRSLSKELIDNIIAYINDINGFILVDEVVYPPESKQLVRLILESTALRFVENPIDFLNSLSTK